MSNQYFSIQQLSFNIGFSSKEKGYELQNKVSRLYQQQLHNLLQNFFYRTVPQHILIRKDQLLLDLGSLSYNELESELPKRLEKALAEQFPLFLLNENDELPEAINGFESIPAATGYGSLLEFFLNTGTLPWQAVLQSHITWQVMLRELYQQHRNTLSALLYKLGRQQPVRLRLAFQSTDEDMQQIIMALEPVEAPFILAYKKKIAKIQQEKQLVRSDASGFRQAIAYFILTYLLEEKESLFSKKSFIKSVLHQMAAHYNTSFTGLLEVLYEALPVEISAAHSSNSLFALVQALLRENQSSNTASAGSLHLFLNDKGEEAISSETGLLGLLEFFLVTGQLPKQTTAKGAFSWQAVLDELYERDCDRLNILLRRLGRQYDVRKRLAWQLTESALEKIFEVIEPVEAPAIIVYKKNIVEVQYGKQLVTATGTELKRAVSFFILTYLLEEKESVFSKRIFIKSVLRQMADHYNTAYQDLLAVLYEAVPVGKITNLQQASFFQTIQDIYREEQFTPRSRGVTTSVAFSTGRVGQAVLLAEKISIFSYYLKHGTLPSWAASYSREEIGAWLPELISAAPATVKEMIVTLCNTRESAGRLSAILTQAFIQTKLPFLQHVYKEDQQKETPHPARSIPDVLYYFLQYGVMPWWAKEQNSQSPETLLQQLYAHSVEGVLRVLKMAGIHERSKQRLLWQFSEPLLYKVFSHLPAWNKAIAIVELIIQLIEAIPAFGRIRQQSLKHALLDAVWSSYIEQGYNAFNEDHFYTLMLVQLAYLAAINKEEIVHLFREAISREKQELTNAGSYDALMRFEQAVDLFRAGNAVITMEPVKLVTGYMQRGSTATPSGEDRLLHIINILEYYLTWNRFPDGLLSLDKQEQERQLSAMLLFLYHENREALKRILHSDKHSVTARMQLHHLFTAGKGGDHKQVSLLLDAYLEKDALQYIKEMAGNSSIALEAGLKQELEHLLQKAKAGMSAGKMELLRDLLRIIKAGIDLPVVDKELIQLIRKELERRLQQQKEEEVLKNKLEAAERKKEEERTRALQRQLQQEMQKQKEQDEQAARQKQTPLIDKAEKLYIINAGLVLLHPFISTYFTRLNLMDKGQFVNREAQARAVHLLQYLVYNTTEHPEHELVLNKILCNYPLHEPLPLEITPERHEADLSTELLQVVIQRAGKLSTSSIDGFRVSFLHREGVLTETDEAWTLRVEQRGYDMILQTLPWAFGMIRFSWMDKPVHVEWM